MNETELRRGVLCKLADELNVPMSDDICHWGKKSDIKEKLEQQGIKDFIINSSSISVKYQDYIFILDNNIVKDGTVNVNADSQILIRKDGEAVDEFDFFTGKVDRQLIDIYNVLEDIRIENKYRNNILISNETIR